MAAASTSTPCGASLRRRAFPRRTCRGSEPDELLQLLLEGGLTTSGVVTEASGRGIGLDIVREVVARLGGGSSVQTRRGEGTTVEFVLPVSVSSLDALLVDGVGGDGGHSSGRRPRNAPREGDRHRADPTTGTRSCTTGGSSGSCLFRDRYGGRADSPVPGTPGRPWSFPEALRLRPLEWTGLSVRGTSSFVRCPMLAPVDRLVAGASLDAEGHPQLVLDPERARRCGRREEPPAPEVEVAPRAPVLVVDDSLTTRMLEQSILESAGYEVELRRVRRGGAREGEERRYSLFVVDVEMPGMDGFDVRANACAPIPASRGVPAILVTSRSVAGGPAARRGAGRACLHRQGRVRPGELLRDDPGAGGIGHGEDACSRRRRLPDGAKAPVRGARGRSRDRGRRRGRGRQATPSSSARTSGPTSSRST